MNISREELILSLDKQVKTLAKFKFSKLPENCSVDFDDLVQVGWIGAIKAVDRFDDKKNVKLSTFADKRIDGEIKDFLRSRQVSYITRRQRGNGMEDIQLVPLVIHDEEDREMSCIF